MTSGGACVNIIPCEATLESYIRGASFDAILDANRKVDRALAAGALALGARVSVSDGPAMRRWSTARSLPRRWARPCGRCSARTA